jgi:predicted aspartyl protease
MPPRRIGSKHNWPMPFHALGGLMIDAMGIFRTTLGVSALATPDHRRELSNVMVDTGSEYNWIPSAILIELGVAPVRVDRFETADGRILEREVGFALLYAGGRTTAAAVVFAREGDIVWISRAKSSFPPVQCRRRLRRRLVGASRAVSG